MTFTPNDDDRLWKEEEDKGWFRFPSPLRYIILLLIIICVVAGIWYALSPDRRSFNSSTLSLIQADETPYKTKPQDQEVPGIKHQDKLVYGRIRNDQNTPTVEHILPDPEPPIVLAKEEETAVKMVDQYVPEDIQLDPVSDTASEAPKASISAITSIEDLIEGQPAEDSKVTAEPQKTPKPEKKVSHNPIFIQLGSLKSYELAQSEWTRITGKHKDILGNHEPLIQKVDLGVDKGIYYRLRIGQDDIERAQKTCTDLKERKVDCLVIY
ncbi:MAG: SPOR domain-containing protein [Proteobacteria bacterium]|nr:SPOR domain-containing protein [Pseudomonadota bacterium]